LKTQPLYSLWNSHVREVLRTAYESFRITKAKMTISYARNDRADLWGNTEIMNLATMVDQIAEYGVITELLPGSIYSNPATIMHRPW